MDRRFAIAVLALIAVAAPVSAGGITGKYVEARTCDIWTGACFANSEMNIAGKHAVLGWKVEKGALDDVSLDGLSVVAVIAASDTLGMEQTGAGKAILIVDSRASESQKAALVNLAKKQGGELIKNVVAVESAKVELTLCECENQLCARLKAGDATIETRCLKEHDKTCGHEGVFYPPLAKGVSAKPAVASQLAFTGKGLTETWKETDRRGAFVGTFEVR